MSISRPSLSGMLLLEMWRYSPRPPYKYRLRDPKEFRVVRVAAGVWNDQIRCELIECTLGEDSRTHPYTALSYVWGPSSVTDEITIDEIPFKITLNLYCALRHLRKVDEAILLWVDALCINQEDHEERSLQVSIMQSIYRNAGDVVVFMGDGRDHRVIRSHLNKPPVSPVITLDRHQGDNSFSSDILKKFRSSGPQELASTFTAAACAMSLIYLFSDQDAVEQRCLELAKWGKATTDYLFECLRAFVVCPWWSRIWVVQEITVGTAATIQYGTVTLSWETLVATANVWSLPKARQVASSAGIEPENLKVFVFFANQVTGLEEARRRWHAEGGTDLVRLLQEFSDRRATDDRDKVYGLLSLVKQDQQYLEPDYRLDVFETYRATVLALIGYGGSLACWAGDQKRKFNRGLPSWIPDWSTAVDNADKRRMDLFESYGANRGWTLKVIQSEREYWTTVADEMQLLINSPAGKAKGLPESLEPFVLDYMECLMQMIGSMLPFKVVADAQDLPGMESLEWDQWNESKGNTLRSATCRLKWCEQHGVLPRSGLSLLQRWIRDLEMRHGEIISESLELPPSRSNIRFDEKRARMHRKVHDHLRQLGVVMEGEGIEEKRRMFIAQYSIYNIEAAIFGPEIILEPQASQSIQDLIDVGWQCWQLLSLCSPAQMAAWNSYLVLVDDQIEATDNAVRPNTLFNVSYVFQGQASWMTDYQHPLANAQQWGSALPPSPKDVILESILAMQMVRVDNVVVCGSRQFGWADTESALIILVSWLYLLGDGIPSGASTTAEGREVKLNHGRIRQFAKTIIGGMCWLGDSYQEADEGALGPLEHWLRQCLVAGRESDWPDPGDNDDDNFAPVEDRASETLVFGTGVRGDPSKGGYAVNPPEKWLRKFLAARAFSVPPSAFFEKIQLATDGRVFFLTQNGSMGLGPASIRPGDSIHILPSGSAHFVLRNKPVGAVPPEANHPRWTKAFMSDRYELIGDCYLHTDSAPGGQEPAEEELAVKGSLPFELLGAGYLRTTGLPERKTVLLV